MALQTASLVSTALSYPHSAGQLTVSVLLLLVLSAAARYSELYNSIYTENIAVILYLLLVPVVIVSLVGSVDGGYKYRKHHLSDFK